MRRRLLVTYLTLTAVVLTVLVIPLGVVNARNEKRDLAAKVERDAQAVASIVEDALERGVSAPQVDALAAAYGPRTGGRVVVVDRAGRSVTDSASAAGRAFASRPEIRRALGGDIATGTRRSRTLGTDLLYVAVPVASGGNVHGAVRITYPLSTLDARVRRYWLLLCGISVVALGLAAALGMWIAAWASRPLVRLEQAADAAGAGDLSVRAPIEGPPEVCAAARAFNETVAKLDLLLSTQSAFVADASHQLRTPLTAMRLRLENLQHDAGPDVGQEVGAALAEVDRLNDLVDALLSLARLDAVEAPSVELDLGPLVGERVEVWRPLAEERGVHLAASIAAVPPVRSAPARLAQALDNVFANALEAAPAGSPVVVQLADRGDVVEIVVRDHGPGLTDVEKARAFERFWTKSTGSGSGLGLPVARRLVETDGGSVALEDAPDGGLDAVIRLPSGRRR